MRDLLAICTGAFVSLYLPTQGFAQQEPPPVPFTVDPATNIMSAVQNPVPQQKLNQEVIIPVLYVKGYPYEQAKVLTQDDSGKVVFSTSSGRLECLVSDVDPSALLRLRKEDPVMEEFQRMEEKYQKEEEFRQTAQSFNHDLLADEPLNTQDDEPGGVLSIEGTWKFVGGSLGTFEGNIHSGEMLNEKGDAIATYRGTAYLGQTGLGYSIYFKEGTGSDDMTINMHGADYFTGQDTKGNRIRAYKLGYAPNELPSSRVPAGVTNKTPSEIANVDKDYLRLVRCLIHPWTSDREQGPNCGVLPGQEIDARLGNFDGGTNPETRGLMADISKRRKDIEDVYQRMENELAALRRMPDPTRQFTTTQTNVQGMIVGTTTTTEVDTTAIPRQMEAVRTEREAEIAKLTRVLDDQYRKTTVKLCDLIPKMYETKKVLPRLVTVLVTDEGLVVENVSGYALSNLTVKVELLHGQNTNQPDDYRLFYTPCLHMGQKRYSSALNLTAALAAPAEQEIPVTEWKLLKVTAWSREGMQKEEVIDLAGQKYTSLPASNLQNAAQSPSTAKSEILNWTNKSGKTIRAVLMKLEGDNVVIKNTTGELFTVPLATLDEVSQAQARERNSLTK